MKYLLVIVSLFFVGCYTPTADVMANYHKSGKVYVQLVVLPSEVQSSIVLKQETIKVLSEYGLTVVKSNEENMKKYSGYKVSLSNIRRNITEYDDDGLASKMEIFVTVTVVDLKSKQSFSSTESTTITVGNYSKSSLNSAITNEININLTNIFAKLVGSINL